MDLSIIVGARAESHPRVTSTIDRSDADYATRARADDRPGIPCVASVRKCDREFLSRLDLELCEHLAQVVLDRAGAQEEATGDFAIREPFAGEVSDLRLLWREVAACLDPSFASRRAGGTQLACSALRKRIDAHLAEQFVRDAKLLPSVEPPPLAA